MMNLLQEMGIQRWRLRGSKAATDAVVAPEADIHESAINERPIESTTRVERLEPQASVSTTVEPEPEPAPRAGFSEPVHSPLADSVAKPQPKLKPAPKPATAASAPAMPKLRPAPIPLAPSAPVMDLRIDQADTAEPAPKATQDATNKAPAYPDEMFSNGDAEYDNTPPPDFYGDDLGADAFVASVPDVGDLSGLDWRALQARISNDQHCPSCGKAHSVLGFGDVLADWMFISDAPTSAEIEAGQFFAGRAGQLYDAVLHALSLNREQVYTTSVFKCAPPADLALSPQCDKIIHRQIQLVQPKVIIAFGEFASQAVLRANEAFDVLRERPQVYPNSNVWVIPSSSPKEMLSQAGLKAQLWSDLKRALLHVSSN